MQTGPDLGTIWMLPSQTGSCPSSHRSPSGRRGALLVLGNLAWDGIKLTLRAQPLQWKLQIQEIVHFNILLT